MRLRYITAMRSKDHPRHRRVVRPRTPRTCPGRAASPLIRLSTDAAGAHVGGQVRRPRQQHSGRDDGGAARRRNPLALATGKPDLRGWFRHLQAGADPLAEDLDDGDRAARPRDKVSLARRALGDQLFADRQPPASVRHLRPWNTICGRCCSCHDRPSRLSPSPVRRDHPQLSVRLPSGAALSLPSRAHRLTVSHPQRHTPRKAWSLPRGATGGRSWSASGQ